MIKNSYKIANPHVVAEDFGSEVVILNLENGKYYSANGCAASLWRDVSQGKPPHEIIENILDKTMQASVTQFISKLIDEGLVLPTTENSQHITASEFIATLETNPTAPSLEVFDDMSELILSDPIHDVDEDVGWPIRKD